MAMRIPLYHVDAFTARSFGGNPAAVCPLDAWLDDSLLLKVAAENNLSETAFFVSRGNLFELRWFSPRCEVELCGHATLASAYVLLAILRRETQPLRFETRCHGALLVRKESDLFSMDFPALPAKSLAHAPDDLVRSLGQGQSPCEVFEANDTYVAVYENENAIRDIRPDFERIERFHPFAVTVTAPGDEVDFVSRYFAPSYGIPEDPVTGSSHCGLAPYWARRLGRTRLSARQLSQRGGELWCEMAGDRVILKGAAVLTLEGTLAI